MKEQTAVGTPNFEIGERFRYPKNGQEFEITHRFLGALVLKNFKTGKEEMSDETALREEYELGYIEFLG